MLGLSGPELTSEEIALYRKIQPGGFILFTRNIVDPAQTRKLTDDLRDLCNHDPFIAIDNEGGGVWRTAAFGPTPPSAAALAEENDPKLIATHGNLTGRLLAQIGVNFNLAPVLDVDHFPDKQNALRGRCWGTDDQRVVDHAGTFNRIMRKQGVMGCGKHFPAGGRAIIDPHYELPTVDTSLDDILSSDLIPYTALMPELDGIMLAHIHFPKIDTDSPGLPSSLSRKIITNLLRDQVGYNGLVLTDDLDMGAIQNHYGTPAAAKEAVLAGADLLLLCHEFLNAEETLSALADIPHAILDDAMQRIEKAQRKIVSPPSFDGCEVKQIHHEIAELRSQVTGEDPVEEMCPGQCPPRCEPQSPVEKY